MDTLEVFVCYGHGLVDWNLYVLVDVVYKFEGKRQHNYKNYCG